jgi:hypothetical protein
MMAIPTKRTTVYFDPTIHRALKLKSIETSKSVSELVNMAVKEALVQDAEDLATVEIKFSDIELAFDYVSSMPMTANTAVLCKNTGDFFYSSDYDSEDEIPEDIYDREDCIVIPHKNEIDLGKNLVFEFVEKHLPDDFEHVRQMFRKRGAYARYKNLLENRDLLKKWYDFEHTRQTETIREWCKENGIIPVS